MSSFILQKIAKFITNDELYILYILFFLFVFLQGDFNAIYRFFNRVGVPISVASALFDCIIIHLQIDSHI